jgi:GNAT superfamily N-acetyltransferase
MDVTTWYLDQTDAGEVRPAGEPSIPVEIVRSELVCPEFNRFLYTAVGGDWFWTDRLGWSWSRWREWLDRPGVETWVAWSRGTPAGYGLLDAQAHGQVEVADFGLLPAFIGRRVGGFLLTEVLRRAWSLAERWPERERTRRVWVHTCSLDGPAALPNYEARGMRRFRTETTAVDLPTVPPGPWPGAGRAR